MPLMTRLILVCSCACLILVVRLATSQTAPPPMEPTTTASGVYTAAQAARGEETYMNMCVGCHAAGTYSTPAFREKWDRHPLSELYALLSETMPKQDPASLTPQEYAQLVAYLLKINEVSAGKTELGSDLERLKKITIEMPGVTKKQ
jgi:S-disulfanyl-L-cysteine oxidoreductase SoxD